MYKIISDTGCDWSLDYAKKNDVDLVSLYITFEDGISLREGREISREDFYRKMIDENLFPKTSTPSVSDYFEAIEAAVKDNKEVIILTISSSLSASFQSANLARDMIMEEYPQAKISVIDSKQDATSQSLMVYEAVRMRNKKIDFETSVNVLLEMADNAGIIFTMNSLEYLYRGGRIGKLASVIGGKLNLNTLIIFKNGKIKIGGICRTRGKAKDKVLAGIEKLFDSKKINTADFIFNVESGYNFDERDKFRDIIKERFSLTCQEDKDPEFLPIIGAVTACHTGPYTLGFGYVPRFEACLAALSKAA